MGSHLLHALCWSSVLGGTPGNVPRHSIRPTSKLCHYVDMLLLRLTASMCNSPSCALKSGALHGHTPIRQHTVPCVLHPQPWCCGLQCHV